MHSNSDGYTGFLEKICFFLILVKLSFQVDAYSCRFSKVIDFQARWIGLGRKWILRAYQVLMKFETHL